MSCVSGCKVPGEILILEGHPEAKVIVLESNGQKICYQRAGHTECCHTHSGAYDIGSSCKECEENSSSSDSSQSSFLPSSSVSDSSMSDSTESPTSTSESSGSSNSESSSSSYSSMSQDSGSSESECSIGVEMNTGSILNSDGCTLTMQSDMDGDCYNISFYVSQRSSCVSPSVTGWTQPPSSGPSTCMGARGFYWMLLPSGPDGGSFTDINVLGTCADYFSCMSSTPFTLTITLQPCV